MKTVSLFLGILSCLITSFSFAEEGHKKSNLIIDPTMRAHDYLQAFKALKKEKPSNKVCITLLSGLIVSNIIEMQRMANSTLFMIRYNSPQGIKLQVGVS